MVFIILGADRITLIAAGGITIKGAFCEWHSEDQPNLKRIMWLVFKYVEQHIEFQKPFSHQFVFDISIKGYRSIGEII